ncbi:MULTISPECIES: hypothetical protein [unclassified Pseudomonas]|uniref:hypothetical protein n=1 Tax=unclassified Pseudomonas TaxID=196821 RepID=UPI00244ACEBF|nr:MULTISPECIES: hypothetical protein [unclassified Pseudomonas]MDG9923304.1 hypothetical protein [Pseudomonas sp. GD04045]MDH0034619.1 hypothetical protein [Pseudomonas sp. GD04019]
MHKVLGLALTMAMTSTGAMAQECDGVFLHFTTRGEVSDDDGVTSVDEQLLLNQTGLFQYGKSLEVMGSTREVATDSNLDYNRFYPDQPGPSVNEMLALAQRLKTLGIFNLQSDPSSPAPQQTYLNFRADCQETRLSFATTEAGDARSDVIAEIRTFFDEQASRHGLQKRERISQGDNRLPVAVSIAELLSSPERYDGKRITTSGSYRLGYESSTLSDGEHSLWIGRWSAMVKDTTSLQYLDDHQLTVDGIFFAGPSGHLGGYPGEIVRLTRVTTR